MSINMTIRVKFLGSGAFAEPIKQTLAKRFGLADREPDLTIVANYGKILDEAQIVEPKYGTLNVHPSCLPKYRGAAPLQTALLQGEKKTCVCVIKMVKKVDAGPILACEEVEILPQDTFADVAVKTGQMAAKILPYLIISYISGSISPQRQDESQATYTKKLSKEDGLMDFTKTADYLERQIRAYNPWPGAYTLLEGSKRLIIHKARVIENKLIPELVQLEGKKPLPWDEFKRGFKGKEPIQGLG